MISLRRAWNWLDAIDLEEEFLRQIPTFCTVPWALRAPTTREQSDTHHYLQIDLNSSLHILNPFFATKGRKRAPRGNSGL